jgi:hypothetical protein
VKVKWDLAVVTRRDDDDVPVLVLPICGFLCLMFFSGVTSTRIVDKITGTEPVVHSEQHVQNEQQVPYFTDTAAKL